MILLQSCDVVRNTGATSPDDTSHLGDAAKRSFEYTRGPVIYQSIYTFHLLPLTQTG